jgi:hypothetical protein
MNLFIHAHSYAICRLGPEASIPAWAQGNFVSMTYTCNELSVVCLEQHIPPEIQQERQWRILEVEGPMDLSLVGIMATLTQPLANAGVNVFVISTFDTDYILIKEDKLEVAKQALIQAGHYIQHREQV